MRAGIIGLSDGNGHPYSWAAICNGFNSIQASKCPFPVIPQYLSEKKWPEAQLKGITVTHVWTQSDAISESISSFSNIPHISPSLEALIEEVDVVLLARDDAENHYKYALPVIMAGKPIYIDKPFALTMDDAEGLWKNETSENQIFTCSALQFADELQPELIDRDRIGKPKIVWATVPKSWKKYGVHIIEPILNMFPDRGNLLTVRPFGGSSNSSSLVEVTWSSGLTAYLQTTGDIPTPIWFRVMGEYSYQDLYFKDTFTAFRNALSQFVKVVNGIEKNISKSFTMEMVEILEKGIIHG